MCMSEQGVLRLVKKIVRLTSRRGLRFELEFDDQEMEIDGEQVILNGSTVIRGQSDGDQE